MDDAYPDPNLYARPTTRGAEGFDRYAFSVRDCFQLQELGLLEGKYELIAGEIVPMNAEMNKHGVWKRRITRKWAPILATTEWEFAIEATVILEETTFFIPDVTIHPLTILPEDVRPTDCPLIVEIADTSARKDLGLKARAYARHGLAEYWVLDAHTRRAHIFKGPQSEGEWSHHDQYDETADLVPDFLPDLRLKLTDLDF